MTELITIDEDQREIMVQAAVAYDNYRREIQALRDKLSELTIVLEGRNARIEALERATQEDAERTQLYTETLYNRMKMLETQRDEALIERDQMRVVFASFKAQLDCINLPLQSPPRRERKPRKTKDESHTNGHLEPGVDQIGDGETLDL